MSRSIHRTHHDIEREQRFDYADRQKQEAKIDRMFDELAKKRLIKKQVKAERATEPLPVAGLRPEDIPIDVLDENDVIHYPASPNDIREVMGRCPKGVADGLSRITLRLGDHKPVLNEEDFEDAEPDPLTGRYGYTVLPGVFGPRCLGVYNCPKNSIDVHAYVYESNAPYLDVWHVYLRLQMLSTFAHEIGHHDDFSRRLGRGRWRGDSGEKAERYAEGRQDLWVKECVVPYLETVYPNETRTLLDWIEKHGGIRVSLAELAGDPRITEKDGVINITKSIWGIPSAFENLAEEVVAGKDLTTTRLSFARQLHFDARYDDALSILERLLATDPEHIDVLILKADIFVHQEKYEAARLIVEQVIGMDKGHLQAWEILADICEGCGEWKKLKDVATHALTLVEGKRWSWVSLLGQRVHASVELKHLEQAEADLKTIETEAERGGKRHAERIRKRFVKS
ncbi:MAG: tetratricopeptide repeat protein [Kiritimatiellae bacterium]|nr:tetratricopeptide repeat protein [Kiritimatiellia bacterium]